MERLIRPGKSGLTESGYHVDSLELVRDFENAAVELYRTILEFQIRLVKQHSRSWAERYGRDVFKVDVWTSLTGQIKALETKCAELAQDLSREKIEMALQDSERNMQCGFQKIQQEIERTTRGIEQQTLMQSIWCQTDEERRCVQLFRQSNPYENQKNRTPRRVLETGKWFLENKKFLDWRENEGSDLLWLSAKPGSGKSVLARTLIDEGLVTLSHQKQTAVCYFFFKDISPYQRSALSAMSAILHQLFSAFPSLVKHALIPYGLNGKELLQLFDEMFDILCEAAADPVIEQVVCVLDALDECDDDDRVRLVETITSFYYEAVKAPKDQPKLKFLLTSRPYSNIHSQFHEVMKETPTIHWSGDQESERIKVEINHVIDVDIPKLAARKGFDGEATEYLLEQLHQVDNRTYLWLNLVIEEIRLSERPANKRELRKIISDLPQSLVDAFDAILKRCRHRELARQLLHIILAAREPLTVDDMRIATALAGDLEYRSYEEIGNESSDEFELRIKNICGLFVTIDGGCVFLIHQTAKEFLRQTNDNIDHNCGPWRHTFSAQDSETLIATICIALLSFTCFSKDQLTIGAGDSDQARDEIFAYTNDHPFLGYAAKNWIIHSEEAKLDNNPKWMLLMASLCTVTKPVFQTWYIIYQGSDQNRLPRKITSLNLAAAFGFTNVLGYFLENGEDPNEQDSHGATPLARAAKKSQRAVQLLLDANADINAYGWEEPWYDDTDSGNSGMQFRPFTGTPLTMAVISGDAEMVEYLISRGAEINFPPLATMTPLIASIVCNSSTDICRQLLCHGAKVSFETLWGRSENVKCTAVHLAAGLSNPSILRMLLESETININHQTAVIANGVRTEGDDATGSQLSCDTPQTEISNPHLFPHDPDDGGKTNERIENVDADGNCESDEDASVSDNDNASENYRSEINEDDDESDTDSQWSYEEDAGLTALHIAVSSRLVENAKILL
jgi:ankyrin repeat protein